VKISPGNLLEIIPADLLDTLLLKWVLLLEVCSWTMDLMLLAYLVYVAFVCVVRRPRDHP